MRQLWILALFALGMFSLLALSDNTGWGLIEIKEYKVINSKAVCGDKLCKEADEVRSKKGLSTRDIKVCGDEPCKYSVNANKPLPKNIDTPLGKSKFGFLLHQISCNDGLVLILKASNNNPACVKAENANKLITMGWGLDFESQKQVLAQSREMYSLKTTLSSNGDNGLLSATFDKVYEQNFVIFAGIGWHGLHNVEVTISSDHEIIDSVRSQTTENGRLWMHWPIPDSLPPGQYNIHASDGIHQSQLVILISKDPHVNVIPTTSYLEVVVNGEKQVRRGAIHSIEVQVNRDGNPIVGAKVIITIEDYGEDIIKEFEAYTNQDGYFVFSWEIPNSFDDIETLLAYVDVTDGISSKTNLFKFQVYCLPIESGCQAEGN